MVSHLLSGLDVGRSNFSAGWIMGQIVSCSCCMCLRLVLCLIFAKGFCDVAFSRDRVSGNAHFKTPGACKYLKQTIIAFIICMPMR